MKKSKDLMDDLDAELDFEQKLVNSCAMGLYGADLLPPLDLSKIPFKEITPAAYDTEHIDHTEEQQLLDKTFEDFKKTCAMDRRQFRTEDGIVGVFKLDDAGKPVFVPIDPKDMKFNEIPWRMLNPPKSAYDGSTLNRLEVDMFAMGIDPYRKGYQPSSAVVIRNNKKEALYFGRPDKPQIPFPELVEEMTKYYPTPILEEKPPVIAGQDIITIRALTGKRKDEAIKALNAATVEMMDKASPDCFYIPSNVASSKNGKNPITVRNYNKKTGKAQEFTTLVPSDVTKRYIKDTKAAWLQNKVAFLNQTRNLPIPLKVEFTFIRDSLRAFDFINAAQVLMDLMGTKKGYGWIPDDETAQIVPVFNPTVFYHKELAGVLIRIIK